MDHRIYLRVTICCYLSDALFVSTFANVLSIRHPFDLCRQGSKVNRNLRSDGSSDGREAIHYSTITVRLR